MATWAALSTQDSSLAAQSGEADAEMTLHDHCEWNEVELDLPVPEDAGSIKAARPDSRQKDSTPSLQEPSLMDERLDAQQVAVCARV